MHNNARKLCYSRMHNNIEKQHYMYMHIIGIFRDLPVIPHFCDAHASTNIQVKNKTKQTTYKCSKLRLGMILHSKARLC